MHNCVTSHLWLKAQDRLARVIPSMHVHLCVALWLISLHPSPVFYFVPPFSFQPFQMFFSEFNERSRSKPLCNFRSGTVATSDHETPLTDTAPPLPDMFMSHGAWVISDGGMLGRTGCVSKEENVFSMF